MECPGLGKLIEDFLIFELKSPLPLDYLASGSTSLNILLQAK